MNNYLDYFDNYVFKGLMPIAVYQGTKQPVGKGWNVNWSVRKWRKYFLESQEYEIGLLWNNNMIDIETDSKQSNDFLNRLIGGIDRPIYKSHRSYHNIFISPHKELKKVNLYGKLGEKIEIFGRHTFTMAPPSKHLEKGVCYEFVNDIWPPPPCPNNIKSLYFQQKNIKIVNKKKKVTNCEDCGRGFVVHKSRLSLEMKIFISNRLGWKCIHCRKKYLIDIKKERRILRSLIKKSTS